MRTSYNAQICRGENSYSLQFETDSYELFKMVEKACQSAVDKAEKVKDKNRSEMMSALGHL